MAQDRLTEGGRSIVWRAVMEAINGARRKGALQPGLVIKFERLGFGDHWQPGDPDDGISEQEIQTLTEDIAADACKRVEEALNRLDPPEVRVLKAADKAAERWYQRKAAESCYAEPVGPVATYPVADVVKWDPETGEPFIACEKVEGPPEPRWQVWKKRYIDGGGWMTHARYRHLTAPEAHRQAAGFQRQMTVVDVKVLPMGERPGVLGQLDQLPAEPVERGEPDE